MASDSGFRITKLHAFTTIDENDVEGVIGIFTRNGWLPAIAADPERLASFRPMITEMAKEGKMTIKLSVFSVREDVETFSP